LHPVHERRSRPQDRPTDASRWVYQPPPFTGILDARTMNHLGIKLGRVSAAIVLALLAGCGGPDGPPPRTLTTLDAQGMTMPGNATGSLFAGTYVVTASTLDACRCRSGSCANFHAKTGGVTVAMETDGTLTLNSVCKGGVNSDGTFWCGESDTMPGGTIDVAISTGTFTTSNGQPSGFQALEEITVVTSLAGQPQDCDLRGNATARFVGP
jgi:hypothetical protein